MITIPKCAAPGCDNPADPRWWAHAPDGKAVMICDGHEGTPCEAQHVDDCTCPTRVIRVERFKQVCWGFPTTWEGFTLKGEPVYIRFRWGTLRLDINGKTVRSLEHGDPWLGVMSTDEMVQLLQIHIVSYETTDEVPF